jgi:hypothetical protein
VLAQVGQHGLDHLGPDRGGRGMVEVDGHPADDTAPIRGSRWR